MDRVVDISSENLHLSISRGFLVIAQDKEEQGRVPLDDIGALITHAHGLTWSNNALVKLSERNIPIVICASNHAPVSCVWPLQGHHLQGARMRAQSLASAPVKKKAWQQIVAAKIRMQGAVLNSCGQEAGAFENLARKVRSGDPENIEAQAARRYWRLLFGSEFTRDRNKEGANALLNYGYTVLRAIVSRSICASGLHPTLGIHHSNQSNAFALADDIMEPYRPLVDKMVTNFISQNVSEVTSEAKRQLASLGTFDVDTSEGMSPLSVQIGRLTHSLAISFQNNKVELNLPQIPSPIVLAAIGKIN